MPIVSCILCRERFYSKPNWIRKGWGKYCSIACKREGQKNGVFKKCFMCGSEVYRTPKALRKSKSKKFFCNKSCQTLWRNSMVYVGQAHPNWKGGQYIYRETLIRASVPRLCKLCRTKDVRVLAVHHIDRNRKNNKLSNLAWLCHNCHFLVHHDTKEQRRFTVAIAQQ